MARGSERTNRRSPKDAARRTKKKPCALCRDKVVWVDYKDVNLLRKYMSDRGKIRARRVTGNCAQHQRAIALAIKTARELVLLPYTQRTTTERSGGRGRSPRGDRFAGRGPRPDTEAASAGATTEDAATTGSEAEVSDNGARQSEGDSGAPGVAASNGATDAEPAETVAAEGDG
jgi:small subunit ribosomal protein S18